MKEPIYRRVLLKLSGEILSGENGFGIDPGKANFLAQEVKSIHKLGAVSYTHLTLPTTPYV